MSALIAVSQEVPGFKPASMNGDMAEILNASKETLFETATLVVEDRVNGSHVFDSTAEAKIPKFEMHEMRLGRILGRGGFCVVTEIDKVTIPGISSKGSSIGSNSFTACFRKSPSVLEDDPELFNNPGSDYNQVTIDKKAVTNGFPRDALSRVSIAQLARKRLRKGGRFALKRVAPELASSNKTTYLKGIVDLAIEAKFLSALDHPNIISLCGISKHGACDFIIVEKLHDTLSRRFKDWMKIDRQCKGITGVFAGSRRKVQELYESRISVAYDIAKVTDYLHSRNIVFRDLVSIALYMYSNV
jgi:serine/threonine protein kinase